MCLSALSQFLGGGTENRVSRIEHQYVAEKQKSAFFFPEHLRRECGDDGIRVAPTAGLESGFATGVVEESLPVPAILDGYLRQEEAARNSIFEENPVPADDHLFRADAPQWSESGDLDVCEGQLFSLQGGEAGILESGGDRVVPNRSPQRHDADHVTDTSSEPALDLESHEGAAKFVEDRVGGFRRGGREAVQATLNRLASEGQQKPGGGIVDGVIGWPGNHLYQDGIVTP